MSLISSAIRESAKGKECQVRLPGICNHDSSTVVLAHVGGGSGIAQKCDDIHSTYICSACHDVIDGRAGPVLLSEVTIRLYTLEAMIRTQRIFLKLGLIQVPDEQ
ncbi:hypothetical protein N473_15720 [Pseudoalteromonas luteoviolacea CPMOR-1]|uniref:DUF1364 domain-containing protein n=1 Tax=Pseudoalteromonas luteoviolacea CPMOR-1 TaxID=1365248 RepID=A0A167L7L0_9GAMM|nr:nuclease domain-containing protein [Pseudoalteromonas luteoviolacea]KZN64039.1 hypothetical protein N473_15720 [Pseudoalteromonas luteoviolacea CPMOR-1]